MVEEKHEGGADSAPSGKIGLKHGNIYQITTVEHHYYGSCKVHKGYSVGHP